MARRTLILDDTVDVVLEVANFTAGAIRNTGKRLMRRQMLQLGMRKESIHRG